ncbi:MAG: putative cAMP-dependent regulatory protein [uncultured bacterium (gcode 4)]|uniref:Putative cAMP-dependent regulatory protein n=1 Tax=uncultured bacterium (gcode 4) TaxID=1234023 RepID=K2G466_9BACT|nr:MAG: putative cAMP-dependent regulatory protein [uncultured bacterium (gcode 4)]
MSKDNIYIFEGLSKEEVSYFILMSETQDYKKWEKIIMQWGMSNKKAYIIEKWSAEVYKDWEKVATLREWDIFWEIALIINEPRTATVMAKEDMEALVLNKDDFLMLYQKSWQYQEIKDRILDRIRNNFYGIKE